MKKLLLLFSIFLLFVQSANANFLVDGKNVIVNKYQACISKGAVKSVMKEQIRYSDKYDLNALSNLYSDKFVSSDGFNKEIYFKLIKDTWKSYPDISYKTKIKNIKIDGNSALVNVEESSIATTTQVDEGTSVYGELNSISDGIYYLEKIDNKWFFTGEKINTEKSVLKYGDTRFVNMDLQSPQSVKAGEYYTASLSVDVPKDSFIIASIGRDVITYPQQKSEEIFRKLSDDNMLERMFLANKNGRNEYNVASVGMSKSRIGLDNKIHIYMAGIAFVLTRVNVESVENGK